MTFQDYSYIFIVTYGRSGSTLLQSLLNSLDGVQIRGENDNALLHLFRAIESVKRARTFGGDRQRTEPDEPWYGSAEMRPVGFRNTLLNSFVRNVLRPDEGKTVLGFKEIRYSPAVLWEAHFVSYMNFLLTTFPDAKIIFNTRNVEDVARSSWNAEQDPEFVKAQTRACDERFARYDATSERTMLMHYDDYVADRSKIAGMFEFLGHSYDADTVETVFSKPLRHARK